MFLLANCQGVPAETAGLGATVAGRVLDENGAPIANVTVTESNNTVVSDAQGQFTLLSETAGQTGTLVVYATHDGYAHVSRRVPVSNGGAVITLTMRQADQVLTLTMPDPNKSVAVNLTHGDVSAVLNLWGQTLQNPNGDVVNGNITATLTMWSPNDLLESSPGILRASLADGTVGDNSPRYLRTYGMIDIALTQNGQALQIIPGQTATLDLVTTPALRTGYATRSPAIAPPSLWTMNPNTGLWDEDVGDGVYDPNTGILHATLRHLSSKNSDEPITANNDEGGCFHGQVVDQCGQPLAGVSVAMQFQSQLFAGVNIQASATSDSQGNYYITVSPATHMGYFAAATYRSGQGAYYTTNTIESIIQGYKPADVEIVTASAIPPLQLLPAAAIQCSTPTGQCPDAACQCYNDVSDNSCLSTLGVSQADGRNPCWVNPYGKDIYGAQCYADYNIYEWWKGVPTGTLCQNCWPLITLQIPIKQTATCQGGAGNLTNACTTSTPAALRKGLGDPCSIISGDVCCSTDGSILECADNICVPATDPN